MFRHDWLLGSCSFLFLLWTCDMTNHPTHLLLLVTDHVTASVLFYTISSLQFDVLFSEFVLDFLFCVSVDFSLWITLWCSCTDWESSVFHSLYACYCIVHLNDNCDPFKYSAFGVLRKGKKTFSMCSSANFTVVLDLRYPFYLWKFSSWRILFFAGQVSVLHCDRTMISTSFALCFKLSWFCEQALY